ncbi:MAG: Gfo/Idh/MocA family oxidoreductase [Bryobacterales bacterium]|nr:Gfo/Idh/MocA family oxidoreductase [Bryobacterales bacterium]
MPTRRTFLQTTSAASLAAAQAGAQTRSPNDRIQFALIGAGGMGMGDATSAIAQKGTKIVAVADIYEGRLTRSKELWGNDLFTTRDYREVLSRKDIDAVIVATPDHWHARIAREAMESGKDVYVEKPMVQKIEDGAQLIEASAKHNRILQVGSQRVSSIVYQKAKELLASGAIGELNLVEAWWDRNSAIGAWQYSIPPDATPQNIDWDKFLGSAPKHPFEPIRLFRWRNYKDYGTGVAGDLFVHLFSGLHYVTGVEGPARVHATGGIRFWRDGRDVPDVMLAICDYPAQGKMPAFNLALRVNFVNGANENSGFRFVGSEGTLQIGGGVTVSKVPRAVEPGYTIDTFPTAVQQEFLRQYREKYPPTVPTADSILPQSEEKYNPPRGYSDHLDHHRTFFNAVRSRKPVIEDATFGLRAAGPALLANRSQADQRPYEWDAQKLRVKA